MINPEVPRKNKRTLAIAGAGNRAHFSLTRTKLVPPRLPANPVALERHRLWLEPILRHSLCLVRAPSGYGKSTICTLWFHALADSGHDTAWISFEKQDDDPARAIPYFFAAGHAAGIDQELVYDGLTPPQSLATRFVNAIHDLGRSYILFLDDVDRLTDPRIFQFLSFVLLHCPDNLHIVCACQAHPALPLMFLDAHEMLIRVGIDELRLNDFEASSLLGGGGNALSGPDACKLNTAMAGWVTGLRIGSAALRNNRDAMFDIGLVSHGAHWLSDYLEENIFGHLTPVTRQFLMHCAIVETMTAELCQALSGEASAAKLLAWLADQNLFIQRLDDAGTRFRIHPVFREFLLARLAREAPGLISSLHRNACDWFADNGEMVEAIGHALDAGDDDRAAALINEAAMTMVEHSDIVALLGWIARLPDTAVAKYLPLRLAEAWALTLTLRPQARTLMDELRREAQAEPNIDAAAGLMRELAGIETIFLAVYEDRLDAAVAFGHDFLSATNDEYSFVTRAVRNATAYCESQRGNTNLVHDLVRPSQLHALKKEQLFPTAYRYSVVGLSYVIQGELFEAARTFLTGLELSEKLSGRQSASSGLLSAFMSRRLYERGDLDGAAALLEDRLPIIDEAAFHEAVIDAYVVMIRISALQGQMDKASALAEHAELIGHERGWRRLLATMALERTRLHLPLTTNLDGLAVGSLDDLGTSDLLSLNTRTNAIVAKAKCLSAIMSGDFALVQPLVVSLSKYARATHNEGLSIRIRLMEIAIAALSHPDYVLDQPTIARFSNAVGRGFGRTLLDGLVPISEPRIRDLLAPIAGLGALLDNNARLLVPVSPLPRANTVFSILTSREIDVLTGVGAGDSNKEIARRLHLTPETVKWHLKNVMRKLGADSRAQAVSRAAALGLSLPGEGKWVDELKGYCQPE